jgi:hypothetical protein
MQLEDAFPLTDEERDRLATVPRAFHDEAFWSRWAIHAHVELADAYRAGEISLPDALQLLRNCSLGCSTRARLLITARFIDRVLPIKPKTLNRRKPPFPTWIKRMGAKAVAIVHEGLPDLELAPHEMNGWTTKKLELAVQLIVTLGMCSETRKPTPRTLYKWYGQFRAPK